MVAPAIGYGAWWAWNGYRAWRAAQAIGTVVTAQRTVTAARTLAQALARSRSRDCKEGCDEPDCDKTEHATGDALMNKLCRMACECMKNRGGASSNQKCVENKLRQEQGGNPGRNRQTDGAHPEVSHRPNANGGYDPVMSRSDPGRFSNAPVVSGAPRPDVSVYQGGKLVKIVEMKFPGDGRTQMQADGLYRDIARANRLDPRTAVSEMNVGEECKVP
jgi:hypothetical protein